MALAQTNHEHQRSTKSAFLGERSNYLTLSMRFPVETAATRRINLSVPADMNFTPQGTGGALENEMEKLDRIDFKVLSYLQEHGRVTNVGLSDAVGLSTSPCLYRLKRLEKLGYIKSYGARIALETLGDHLMAFTEVTLTGHRIANFDRFLKHAREVPEIIECHHVTGGYDYLLKVVARSVSHYQRVMEALLEGDAGIGKYSCYIVLGSPIVRDGYPLEQLFDPI